MSASRHTYAVVMDSATVTAGNGSVTSCRAIIFNGNGQLAVYGSKRDANNHAEHMNILFPDERYIVIQLR